MEKRTVLLYGYTGHQSVLLYPLVRRIWDVWKISNTADLCSLENASCDLFIFDGSLPVMELEYVLSIMHGKSELACIALDVVNEQAYALFLHYDVPVVLTGLHAESQIQECSDAVRHGGRFYSKDGLVRTFSASYQECFEKLSPNEKIVCACMLKGMKQEAIALEIGVKSTTVGTWFRRIYAKFGVKSIIELHTKFNMKMNSFSCNEFSTSEYEELMLS